MCMGNTPRGRWRRFLPLSGGCRRRWSASSRLDRLFVLCVPHELLNEVHVVLDRSTVNSMTLEIGQ